MRRHERHSAFTAGYQHGAELQIDGKAPSLGLDGGVAVGLADDGAKLGEIRRNQGGAPVLREIEPLRIDEHRAAGPPRLLYHDRRAGQGALRVVGEHDDVAGRQQRLVRGAQEFGTLIGRRVFEIEPHQLLVTRHHAQLFSGAQAALSHQRGIHARALEQPLQLPSGFIVTDESEHRDVGAECRHVGGDVASAPDAGLVALHADDHYRGFG